MYISVFNLHILNVKYFYLILISSKSMLNVSEFGKFDPMYKNDIFSELLRYESSKLHLYVSSRLHLFESSKFHLYGSNKLHLYESSKFHLYGQSNSHSYGSKGPGGSMS